jgi:nitrate reductase gamma subunit
LLLRRLFRMSKSRWLIHALIYYSILFRCIWGVIGLIASLLYPQWPGTWNMLDKHNPVNAFLFDLTGLLMVVGVVLLVARKYMEKPEERPTGLPPKNWWGAGLLGSILIVGFLLEGMRIAMTGQWAGDQYAFIGYALSAFFSDFDLTIVYGYMWYCHAIFTGVFLVCLPFNRMFHMLMAPVVLAVGAVAGHSTEKTKA